MTIIPVDPAIRAFITEDESLNDYTKNEVRKSFSLTRSNLFEYGILGHGPDFKIELSPSPVSAVSTSKRPLVPMMISLIPPDVFPSGEFTTARIPAPADVQIQLFNTKVNRRGTTVENVESVRLTSFMYSEFGAYRAFEAGGSQTISMVFRTAGNTAANPLPVTFTSSDPSVIEFPDENSGTFNVLKVPYRDVSVSMRSVNQNGEVLTASAIVTFLADTFLQTPGPPPVSEVEGISDNQIETLVSVGEPLGTEFVTNLKERYERLRKAEPQVRDSLEDNLEEITTRRREISDIYIEQRDLVQNSIAEARTPGDNERFLRSQVEAIKALPPLVMYVNPNSFDISYEHLISDGNRSRDGFIVEHWGLQQPQITASGSIGAAYIHTVNGLNRPTGGATRTLRRGSAAYQNFMSLYNTYRNNSYIYNLDGVISVVGSVKIFFDDKIYTGSFDSFTIEESEDNPYSLNYSFTFTVRFEEQVLAGSRSTQA